MAQQTLARADRAPSARAHRTLAAYGLGALATAAGLGCAVVDQLALGSLDRHLHALYDPVGKYGAPGPLYGYLYLVGAVGLLCWWVNIRAVRRRGAAARLPGRLTFAAAALPVLAPLVLQEYGEPVIAFPLAAGYLIAWACGFAGILLLRRE